MDMLTCRLINTRKNDNVNDSDKNPHKNVLKRSAMSLEDKN